MKELYPSRVQDGRGTAPWEFGQLQSKASCLEGNVFLSVMMGAFFAAVLFEYVPAFRALSRGIFKSLTDDMFDMLSDPEAALFVMAFCCLPGLSL